MLSTIKTTAIAVSALAAVSMNANANQVGVEQVVSQMVQNAVQAVATELHYSVQESVLNASHKLSLDSSNEVKTQTSIIDLAAKKDSSDAEKKEQKAE